ncbi:unnamed protein product [Larinioides sclopetarius]|uniref:Uncharacterized protein n=1 Tax=Larinioides sclopetarius TaxID=280406 RepID=A0AAV1YU78_9ARAC
MLRQTVHQMNIVCVELHARKAAKASRGSGHHQKCATRIANMAAFASVVWSEETIMRFLIAFQRSNVHSKF